MTVSVIVPNYNYGRFVGCAVESVLRQQKDIPVQIIVVDNGSTDDSSSVLDAFGDSIEVIRQANAGQAGARNTGIERSSGEFVALLDADDYWLPQKLERQLEASTLYPEASLIFTGVMRVDERGTPIAEELPRKLMIHGEDFRRWPQVAWVLGGESTALIRRDALEAVGTFDTRLSSASGWDLFRRLVDHGPAVGLPGAFAAYRQHGFSASTDSIAVCTDMVRAHHLSRRTPQGAAAKLETEIGRLRLARSLVSGMWKQGEALTGAKLLKDLYWHRVL